MKKDVLILLTGLIVGLGVMYVFSEKMTNSKIDMNGYLKADMKNSRIDAHFIEQMIPHHEDAITMANVALEKAKTKEVIELANEIVVAQSKEIEQMKIWYKEWFGTEVPEGDEVMRGHGMMGGGGMHMGRTGDSSDMTRLENSTEFDKEFAEEMIVHHQMAVMMAEMLKNSTNRPEMEKLAQDIIDAQNKEIQLMRSWLEKWNK